MAQLLTPSGRDIEGYWIPAEWRCDCGSTFIGGGPGEDTECPNCRQIYNAFGQRVQMYWGDYVASVESGRMDP